MATTNNTNLIDLDKLTPSSQEILQNFLTTHSTSSHPHVRTAIRTIITKTNNYDFPTLTYSDYIAFFDDPAKKTTGNKYSTIKSFFMYLYCHDILKDEKGFENCYWNKEECRAKFKKRNQRSNDIKFSKNDKNKHIQALTMEQLERLMLFEHESTHTDEINFKNQRLAFCFYLLFFEDLQVTTIRNNLDAKNFSDGKVETVEKTLDIPERYWDMLIHYKERPYSGFTLLDEYIRQLGNIVGIKDLVPNNITQKRKQNMFTCPECGKMVLSFSSYWKSVNNVLICNDCAERIILSGQKKITEIESVDVELFEENIKNKIQISITSFKKFKNDIIFPTNYIELHKFLIKIGELGEKYVYEQERKRLYEINSDFADMVDATPSSDPQNGYDIISYTEAGDEIFIEVKTTIDTENVPFYISKHELV